MIRRNIYVKDDQIDDPESSIAPSGRLPHGSYVDVYTVTVPLLFGSMT